MIAKGAPAAVTRWDSSAKGANITLSDSDRVALRSGGTGWQTVYGTTGKSSGKWQFEVVFLAGTLSNRPFASLADKINLANLLNSYTGNADATVAESLGYWGHARIYYNLSTGSNFLSVAASAINDIITVTLDLTLGTPEAKFYKNGALLGVVILPTGKTWYPASSLQGSGTSTRLVASGLTYSQSGFTDWG